MPRRRTTGDVADAPGSRDRLRQYHRVAIAFSKDALGSSDPASLLQRATERVAEGMGVARVKVLEYRAETDDLLICAGVGWHEGVVGQASLPSDMASPPGRSFRTRRSVRIANLPASRAFKRSDLLRAHGIVSLLNVPILTDDRAWGVLEVDSASPRRFTKDDEEFLLGFAGVLGDAIESKRRAAAVASTHIERAILLEERELLFRELQHRIANNFQSIMGLLQTASRAVADPVAKQRLAHVLERTSAIVLAHERLSLREVEEDISLGSYLSDLCANMHGPENVRIDRSFANAAVPVRTAVRLGLVLNELVTNSLKHAFGEAGGVIAVILAVNPDRGEGRLVVADNGRGMAPARRRGAGLGLITSLVDQIGGALSQASEPGRGTTMTVTFPLQP